MLAPARLSRTLALLVACAGCGTDRATEVQKLSADHKVAETAFYNQELRELPTDADRIAHYKSIPNLTYLPKFLAIIQADSGDDAALVAARWIVEQVNHQGPQWAPRFEADAVAWRLLQRRKLPAKDVPRLCWEAQDRESPAREEFLRATLRRDDLSTSERAHATAALAIFLADRYDFAAAGDDWKWWENPKNEYFEFLATQVEPKWIEYEARGDGTSLRNESLELFRRVRDEYAEIPATDAEGFIRPGFATLGQYAKHKIYALENLFIGAQAPDVEGHDLDGNPLRLSDYRGKVVLLSFWFPGCGPCQGAFPKERALVEKFRAKPFALLGVCRDDDAAAAEQAAREHEMSWPSWLDGNPGTICDAFNVAGFPTFYLLDAEGRIVSKDVPVELFEKSVEAVLHPPSEAESDPRRDSGK